MKTKTLVLIAGAAVALYLWNATRRAPAPSGPILGGLVQLPAGAVVSSWGI